jgi:hypothetical protein
MAGNHGRLPLLEAVVINILIVLRRILLRLPEPMTQFMKENNPKGLIVG